MANNQELEQKYLHLIQGKGVPVGVKLFKDKQNIPKGVIAPQGDLALCQILKEAAIYKKKRAVSVENMGGCVIGSRVMGFENIPQDLKQRWVERFAYKEEIFDELMEQTEKLPLNEYEASIFAPLSEFDDLELEPEAIIMVVNSSQSYLLTMGIFDKTGKKTSPRINGHAACEIIAPVAKDQEPWLTVPCGGARSIAGSQDDEFWVGLTKNDLEKALERVEETGLEYPPAVDQSLITEPNSNHPLTGLIGRKG